MAFIGEYNVLDVRFFHVDGLERGGVKYGGSDFYLYAERGTDSVWTGPVMSLTDVVLSLFLVQAAMAVVQLFSVSGSDEGLWALRAPYAVFTLHAVSMKGY